MRWSIQKGSDGSVYAYQSAPYDTQRKESCGPSLLVDGKTRCIPTGAGIYGAGSYFSDTGCTKPVVVQLKCQPAPQYILVYTPSSCGGANVVRVYTAGPQPAQVFIGSPTACNPYTLDTTLAAYPPGAEIPPATFVEFSAVEYQAI
jgi:hypothetical protein